jgi:L,D-transpeptidase catalytic domain
MFSGRRLGSRRLAVVAAGVLLLSGVSGAILAAPALADTPAQVAAATSPNVAGTPCTAAASACVDVRKKQAWLIKDGKVFRGPVPIATGGKGEDTPTGNVFRVYRKDKDHKSTEALIKSGPNKGQPAPMPYSVFFEDGGIAFHSGSPSVASAGCVHLNPADAIAFFNFLQVGNHVQVMDGPVAAPGPNSGSAGNDNPSDDNHSDDNHSGDSSDHDNHSGDNHSGDNSDHDDDDDD